MSKPNKEIDQYSTVIETRMNNHNIYIFLLEKLLALDSVFPSHALLF